MDSLQRPIVERQVTLLLGQAQDVPAGSPLDAGLNAILSSDGVKQHGIGFVVWLNIRESPNKYTVIHLPCKPLVSGFFFLETQVLTLLS